jgi:CxxC motif-containing protein (DUF1111 family)
MTGLARPTISALAFSAALLAAADGDVLDPAAVTAGPLTTAESGPAAYAVPVAMLDKEQLAVFAAGREQFNEAWVIAPDPSGVWGLGPTFNEDRCAHCHEHNGRAHAPGEREPAVRGMLVRLSVAGTAANGGPNPHPAYGDQLQNRGTDTRVPAEGQAVFSYETKEVALAGGEVVKLRAPKIRFAELQFGDIGPEVMMSARAAPAMVGLGLLEAIPEKTILEIAQRQASLGVSGRPNYVWDAENETVVLGRFGWKANQPSLRQQTAGAFHGDIGATTFMFPEENCPPVQRACRDIPSASKCGGQGGCEGNTFRPEVVPSRLNNITFYLQALAVPARRQVGDADVKRGEALFEQTNCGACHLAELKTGPKPALRAAGDLVIHPYTDLLLHDMGEELADHRPDFKADGREWRTAPLWGVGLLRTVNGHSDLLHDGRARNVAEAILWHGGEAEKSREAFRAMSKADRDALVKFVESL